MDLHIQSLLENYRKLKLSPRELLRYVHAKIEENKANPIWIYTLTEQELEPYLETLEAVDPKSLPLYGIPFAIKDNIDLAGIPTTAACPQFSYTPDKSASVVQRLLDAGAIPIGKTNMDQFATGLVGVRSPAPWGACKNALNETIISGGSSSGSAVALALGQVSFSLGTDTAGSGRVPAVLNNVMGLKPSRGLLSCKGVVPACKSLDCVSIFSLNASDANTVFDVAAAEDTEDVYSRANIFENGPRYFQNKTAFQLGVPKAKHLEWFGMPESEKLFEQAIEASVAAGASCVEIDLAPFVEAAKLLYEGPWVSERYLAIQRIIENKPEALLPEIKAIISGGNLPSALDTFSAQYKLAELAKRAEKELNKVDAIITPTIPRYYSIEEVKNNPIALNSHLGYYCNFMNLLDCSAIALPVGRYQNEVGFGVTLFHKAFRDKQLLSIADTLQNYLNLTPGKNLNPHSASQYRNPPANCVEVVVCGAHLDGLPLNWQLRERGATLQCATETSENYRFYALPGGPPKRPALVRVNEDGCAIAVEVWNLPLQHFGSFVAEIPAPLGIGKVELADGRSLSGFICDAWGMQGAEDISLFRSWKNYLQNLN